MAKSNRGLGRKPDELLTKLVVKSQGTDGKPSWSCIAPKCSYTAKGFPQNSRVLKHSASCKALREYDEDAYDDAHRAAVGGSLGSQLQQLEPSAKNSESNPSFSTSSPTIVSPSGSSLLTAKGTLDLKTLRTEGSKSKANSNKKFQHEVDHIIMRLICVRGLVPNLVDSPEWKELMQKLNGIYKPSFAVAKLREVRNLAGTDEPVNGLQKIGKTRFGTYWLACTAIDPCLLFIRNLVIDQVIKFKVSYQTLLVFDF